MEHSLIDALLDHGTEKRDHAAHGQPAELFTDDRVAVRVPDLDDGEDQVFLFRLAAGDAREERLQLAQRRHVRVIQERRQVRDGHVGEPLDDRLEQRLLRIEVVVKGALGGVEFVQDVLDAHRLVPFRLDEALGHVQERVATDHTKRGIHGPGHACTISDRRSVYLWLSVRQGAAKQYAVRPVGAGGAERQQVPGVAAVWQDINRRHATAVEKVARVQLAYPAAVAGRVAGRGDDRASVGEDDPNHPMAEWGGRVPDDRDRRSNPLAGVDRPNEHAGPEVRYENGPIGGRNTGCGRKADRTATPAGELGGIVALERDDAVIVDGTDDMLRRRPAGDVVESEQLAVGLQWQCLEHLDLLDDPAVVGGGQVRAVELLVVNNRVEAGGVLRSQGRDLLRRLVVGRHAHHRRSAEQRRSNRVDQPVLQVGRRERLAQPAV